MLVPFHEAMQVCTGGHNTGHPRHLLPKRYARKRYLFTLESAWVAGSIPFFVVAVGYLQRGADIGNRKEHFMGIDGMLAHDCPFLISKRDRVYAGYYREYLSCRYHEASHLDGHGSVLLRLSPSHWLVSLSFR